jgi:hypothetical protein
VGVVLGVTLACSGATLMASATAGAAGHASLVGRAATAAHLGGVVGLDGQVGPLRIGRASLSEVERASGSPQVIRAVGYYGSPAPPLLFTALGYECSGPTIRACATAFYVRIGSDRLESFSTKSSAYSTPRGSFPGLSADQAARRERMPDVDGCDQGIYENAGGITRAITTRGGKSYVHDHALDVAGGRVVSLAVESETSGAGLLDC